LVKGKKLPSADMVGAKAYRAMMAGKRVAIPGCMWWVMAQSVRMMPRNMAADTVRRMSVPA
jgi:short-subunit dehydrogenase